jgi:hypothetical protein
MQEDESMNKHINRMNIALALFLSLGQLVFAASQEELLQQQIDARIAQEQPNLQALQAQWDTGLANLAQRYELSGADPGLVLPGIESASLQQVVLDNRPVVIGVGGPGCAGKGTCADQMQAQLHTIHRPNTTTRDAREYEIDGVHYKFVTLEQYAQLTGYSTDELLAAEQGANAVDGSPLTDSIDLDVRDGADVRNTTWRRDRGWYATGNEVFENLQEGDVLTFEESPVNIIKIGASLDPAKYNFKFVYVLPSQPIAETMARRALGRDGVDQSEAKLYSTIGGRQVSEFVDMTELLKQYPNVDVVILHNDKMWENEGGDKRTRAATELVQRLGGDTSQMVALPPAEKGDYIIVDGPTVEVKKGDGILVTPAMPKILLLLHYLINWKDPYIYRS